MFFEQVTYDSLDPAITREFCNSCPDHCLVCDRNNLCTQCSPYATLTSSKKCTCNVLNCQKCFDSQCDICLSSKRRHIDLSGTITCETRTDCKDGYGIKSTESLTSSQPATCFACADPYCGSCADDHTTCLACASPATMLSNGTCGGLPTCRSPKKVITSTMQCGDCSEEYETLEASDPGFCSSAKPYTVTPIAPSFYTQKFRSYEINSDYFPHITNPNSNELKLTQKIIDNVFQVTLTPSPTTYKLVHAGGNLVQLSFSSFTKNMTLTFSIKNATLEEIYKSEEESFPTKILIQSHHSFNIKNLTSYDQSLLETTSSIGSQVGTVSSWTSQIGALTVILGTLFNFKLQASGAIIKALQFILLFDKLRFIHVKLDNILGVFMNSIYEAFKVNIIDIDDYERTAKYNHDEFLHQRVQVIAYRKKIDKLVMGTIGLIFDLVLLSLQRIFFKRPKSNSARKWVRIAKVYQLVDRVRLALLTLFVVDVVFYCLHQVLHQKISTVAFAFNEDSVSFFWSMILIVYSMSAFIGAGMKLNSIDQSRLDDYYDKIEMESEKINKNDGQMDSKVQGGQMGRSSMTPAVIKTIPKAFKRTKKQSRLIKNREQDCLDIDFDEEMDHTSSSSSSRKNFLTNHLFSSSSKTALSLQQGAKGEIQSLHELKGKGRKVKVRKEKKSNKIKRNKNRVKIVYRNLEGGREIRSEEASALLLQKKDGRLEIDTLGTIKNIKSGEHYVQVICQDKTRKSAECSPNYTYLAFLVRIMLICIPILCFQSVPRIQIMLLFCFEMGYFSYLFRAFWKWRVPKSKLRFTIELFESFCVLNFVAYCAYTLEKKTGKGVLSAHTGMTLGRYSDLENDGSSVENIQSNDIYEIFVIICFVFIIWLQVSQIFVRTLLYIRMFIISLLPKKNNSSEESKEAQYLNNPTLVWKVSQKGLQAKEKESEKKYDMLTKKERELLTNYEENGESKQISHIMNLFKKPKKKYKSNRLLIYKNNGRQNLPRSLRNINSKKISKKSKFRNQRNAKIHPKKGTSSHFSPINKITISTIEEKDIGFSNGIKSANSISISPHKLINSSSKRNQSNRQIPPINSLRTSFETNQENLLEDGF